MSLPLPRRIAQAALLLGAAAAPLVGAGAAQAAAPHQQGLGGPTAVDGALGSTVDGASQKATGLAATTGSDAMRTALPTTGRLVGTTGRTLLPAAQHAASQADDTAGRFLGATAESTAGAVPGAETLPATALPAGRDLPVSGLPTRGLPTRALPTQGLPSLDRLPVQGLPVQNLPVRNLPVQGLPVV
ncbi:ATP-binding protein [Streptomyces sp. HPF1205]|uniref:ATP-binding protein n=1 Tax=Streptomyces sp. HPF1205 TaxID=2873262 RepID=UPI001CED86CC|nr:ATP-binding protein [Streptomyces sp. HPF1205]